MSGELRDDARAVEALLFLSPQPLTSEALAGLLEVDRPRVHAALDHLSGVYGADRGLEVAQIAGGWVLRTRLDLVDVCDRLREHPPEDRLSPAALETLAVVAYLEPVSRPDIGRLRGVSVDSTVANLVDRGLLEEAGRADATGAVLYRTTRAFQMRFGLTDQRDLPPIERFELSGPQAEDLRRRLADAGHLDPQDAPEGATGTEPPDPPRPPDLDATPSVFETPRVADHSGDGDGEAAADGDESGS